MRVGASTGTTLSITARECQDKMQNLHHRSPSLENTASQLLKLERVRFSHFGSGRRAGGGGGVGWEGRGEDVMPQGPDCHSCGATA